MLHETARFLGKAFEGRPGQTVVGLEEHIGRVQFTGEPDGLFAHFR